MHRSADETKQHYIDTMGDQLGPVFNGLWQENGILHLTWNEYRALFGTSEEVVNTLNDAARGFFGMVQSSWWDEILLHICRMTDDRKDVLSVHRMVKLVKPAIRDRAKELLNTVEERVAFAREWRDEHIAHRSLERALNPEVTPLPTASRQAVADAIQTLDDLFHFVENHYCQTVPTYYGALSALAGADSLMYIVGEGLKARAEKYGA